MLDVLNCLIQIVLNKKTTIAIISFLGIILWILGIYLFIV